MGATESHLAWTDIFWTFTSSGIWNTSFKLLFLSTSLYTVYLMLNDYKPTHDPNIDTFKVEYLLGASFVLAVLFPHTYDFTEVSGYLSRPSIKFSQTAAIHVFTICIDFVGLLPLAWICGHITTAIHAAANRRSRNDHDSLSICAGNLQGLVYTQLVVSVFYRRQVRPDPLGRRHNSDDSLFWLFLDLLYKVSISCPSILFYLSSWLAGS